MNKLVLIIAVVLAVIIGGYFILRGKYQAPISAPTAPAATTPSETTGLSAPASAVKEFTISGTEFSLNPASINVKAGDRVKIIFKNIGRAPHNWTIEGLGVSTKTIGGGQTDTIEFTASASGTYSIFCSVPGHRAAGMEGQLIVE